MLQSTHYELKLVEGSDIVNPLVIDRPNYEAIDGVMYENESKSVGSATELKSGTIHALTRSKGNQRFFCFTATSNYEAGDTFTVDSVPVTALLPNGTSLPDMAYVINGTVLCSLIGTLLTVYTVGAGLADDSLRLGGQLPEYYATASALTGVSNTASSAQTMAVNNSNAISEINSNLSNKFVTGDIGGSDSVTIPNIYPGCLIFAGRSGADVCMALIDLTNGIRHFVTASGITLSVSSNTLTITETAGAAISYTIIRP